MKRVGAFLAEAKALGLIPQAAPAPVNTLGDVLPILELFVRPTRSRTESNSSAPVDNIPISTLERLRQLFQ